MSEQYKGTVYTGNIIISKDPVEPDHGVNLKNLYEAFAGGVQGLAIGPDTGIFTQVAPNVEKRVVYVDNSGVLTPVNWLETGGAERAIGFVFNGRLYTNGMYVKGYQGLTVGAAYWVQSDGTIGTTPTSAETTWSVRVGMAVSSSILAIHIYNAGAV